MKCKQCGQEFTPLSIHSKYCSHACAVKYRQSHNMDVEYPKIVFTCAKCGRTVYTEGGVRDKRTRFCSRQCEKKYWRHPPHDNPTSRTNFHSIEEYASWERRTNEA